MDLGTDPSVAPQTGVDTGVNVERIGTMEEFERQTYGDRIAREYHQIHAHLSTPEHVDSMKDVFMDLRGVHLRSNDRGPI